MQAITAKCPTEGTVRSHDSVLPSSPVTATHFWMGCSIARSVFGTVSRSVKASSPASWRLKETSLPTRGLSPSSHS
eukprot:4293230-Amphidinium_carterae.1